MAALATKRSRVYLTSEQAAAAARQFGCARFVYNHLLTFSQSRYSNKIKTSATQRSLELTRLKTEIPWLQEVNAQSLQEGLWIQRIKTGLTPSPANAPTR